MKIELTLAQWHGFCDWIQRNPRRRRGYTATLMPTRHASTYVDDCSDYAVYTVTFTEPKLFTEWALEFGEATAAKRSAKNF